MNYIGLTNYRYGSTYVFMSIAHFINQTQPTTYLGEFFNPRHTNTMWCLDDDKSILVNQTELKAFRDWLSNQDNRDVFKENLITKIDEKYSAAKNKSNYALLQNTISNWVMKICPGHIRGITINDIENLFENNKSVFLIREDLEDSCLSYIYARISTIWNSDTLVEYNEVSYDRALHQNVIKTCIKDYNKLKSLEYRLNLDYKLVYEDLTGNPVDDLKHLFEFEIHPYTETRQPGIPLEYNWVKLLSKEDKIKKMKNYNVFNRDFTMFRKEYENERGYIF